MYKFKSKKSLTYSTLKSLPTNAMTNNQIFHNLNENKVEK